MPVAVAVSVDSLFPNGPPLSSAPPCSCVGFGFIRIRALLVCLFELVLLFYQLISALIILVKPWPSEDTLRWAWFSQPYLAWVWEAPGWRLWLGAANVIFILVYVVIIKMFFHALFTDNPKWVLPHLFMQAFTAALMVFLSLLTLFTLRGHGQGFAMQVVRITGSTMTSGVSGVGSVLFGIEEFHIQAAKRTHERPELPALYRQFLGFHNRTKGHNRLPIDSITENNRTASNEARKDWPPLDSKIKLQPQKSTTGGAVRRSWGLYTPGISMLVALIVYLSIAGLLFPFFIITLQCYYFLLEVQKAKKVNALQDQHLIFAPLSDA
uniref:Transmembrane protein n=1 Tax=Plectus sambesii TaxID=2011161 RepID=A0A914VSW2_9BILA